MWDYVSRFWDNQGKALAMSWVMAALGFVVLKLHLDGLISAESLTGVGAWVVAILGTLIVNLAHHTVSPGAQPEEPIVPKASTPLSVDLPKQ